MATRTYEKGGFTVFWDSTRCIHAGICLGNLHSVFNLKNPPWVNLDDGDVEQNAQREERCEQRLIRVDKCSVQVEDRHLHPVHCSTA
jgi:uncharacterized Fe-S cluster protein YjdI